MPEITNGAETLTFTDDAGNEAAGPVYSLSNSDKRIERPIKTAYEDIGKAFRVFLGYPTVVEQGGVRWISRLLPDRFVGLVVPNGVADCYATAIQRVDGLAVMDTDEDTGFPHGKRANHRVLYTTPTYDVVDDNDPDGKMLFDPGEDPDDLTPQPNPLLGKPDEATLARYVTILWKPATRIVTIPRAMARVVYETNDMNIAVAGPTFAAAVVGMTKGPRVQEAIGRRELVGTLEITHHLLDVNYLPVTAIQRMGGSVNRYPLVCPQVTFPAGTLLYEGTENVPLRASQGLRTQDIKHRWRVKMAVKQDGTIVGHNWFLRVVARMSGPTTRGRDVIDYRQVTSDGLPISIDGGGKTNAIFPKLDHADLFRPEQPS